MENELVFTGVDGYILLGLIFAAGYVFRGLVDKLRGIHD